MYALRQSGVPVIGWKYAMFERNGKDVIIDCRPSDKVKAQNPNGYWEAGSITVQTGIRKDHKEIGIEGDLIKITAEAFYLSEPEMVDKTIVMTRNPRNTLASMKKGGLFKTEDTEKAIAKCISDLRRTYDWLKIYRKNFLVVSYEKLLDNPEAEFQRVCNFIGRGDYKTASTFVNKGLNHKQGLAGEWRGLKELEKIDELSKDSPELLYVVNPFQIL